MSLLSITAFNKVMLLALEAPLLVVAPLRNQLIVDIRPVVEGPTPPNVCCVCDAPAHRVNCCWHLLGLPTGRLTRVSAFKHLKDAGDAPFAKPHVAAIDEGTDTPSIYDAPTELYNDEVLDTATDMRSLESQYHPGYDFPVQNSAINYFDSLDYVADDSLPDLYWPGDKDHAYPRDLISGSSYFDSVASVAPPDLSLIDLTGSHYPAHAIPRDLLSGSSSSSQLTGGGLLVLQSSHNLSPANWSTNVLNATFGPNWLQSQARLIYQVIGRCPIGSPIISCFVAC
jgi:hypothetical protein